MKTFSKLALVAMASSLAFSCGDPAETEAPIKPADFKSVSLTKQQVQLIAGSPDGKLAAGSDFSTGKALIWDVNSGQYNTLDLIGDVYALNNKGQAAGHFCPDPMAEQMEDFAFFYDGSKTIKLYVNTDLVDKPGFDESWNPITVKGPKEDGTCAYAITSDGKLIAGTALNGWDAYPCLWKAPFTSKSDRIDLPVPSSAEMGFEVNGGQARWISADGKTVGGYVTDDMSSNPLVIWELQKDGSYKCNPICKAYFHPFEWEPAAPVTAQFMKFEMCALSSNGKYAALLVQEYTDEFVDDKVARLNLQTKNIELLDGPAFVPNAISNDGTIAGSTNMFSEEAFCPYIWKASAKSAEKLAASLAGTDFEQLLQSNLCYLAPDNTSLVGWGFDSEFETVSFIVK